MKRIFVILAVALFTVSMSSVALADGAGLWKKCAACHGADGKGQTKMGKKLNIRDFTSAKVQDSFTDADITKAIENGVEKDGKQVMKGNKGKLGAAEIAELVKYTRAFKGK